MVDLKSVISESKPMVIEFLRDLGLIAREEDAFTSDTMRDLSNWFKSQTIGEGDKTFAFSRISAFVGNYLIEHAKAEWVIESNQVMIRQPVSEDEGIWKSFSVHQVVMGMLENDRVDIEALFEALENNQA